MDNELGAEEERPVFDELKARRLIDKTVLIGITYEDAEGNVVRQSQLFGTIREVGERGISVELQDGTPYFLPSDPRAFFEAEPGEYRLRSTGEVIVDPDYTTAHGQSRHRTMSDKARGPAQDGSPEMSKLRN